MAERLLMGNEAFAYGALEAGVGLVAGYPGTPSSELVETVARLVRDGVARGVHVEWSTNEKAALEVAAAAAMAGTRALFTCKQVGLNVASDALLSLNYVGVRGGLVLFVADDPGPISSQTEQDTRRFAAFAKVPVLDPATPEQGYAMMKEAFELSERYGCPVIVRPTTRIDHASTFFDVADATQARPASDGGFKRDARFVIFPKRSYEAHLEINERLRSIAQDFCRDEGLSRFNPVHQRGASPRLGIAAGGDTAAYALEALDALAQHARARGEEMPAYRFMQVGTPYPFPAEAAAAFLDGLQDVLVLEELDSVLEEEFLKMTGVDLPVRVHGRLTGEASAAGENSAADAAGRLAAFLGVEALPAPAVAFEGTLPPRPPSLCAGCPHRGAFYAVKRALKQLGIARDDAVLCGDIGCYTLGNAQPLDAVDTCLCMGAGITMAQGFAAADPAKKAVAFVGDSTFFASGITGVVNAVYNDHDITLCVLDNSTTAMTGMQPHPGTGATLMGTRSAPVSIEAVLKAVDFGPGALFHADPLDLDAAVEAAASALSVKGPSAVLFESPCIWLSKSRGRAVVDPELCRGCKRCITEIGCPATAFDADADGPQSGHRGQARIEEGLCTGCGLCEAVCPFGAITASGAIAADKPGAGDGAVAADKPVASGPVAAAGTSPDPGRIPSEGGEE